MTSIAKKPFGVFGFLLLNSGPPPGWSQGGSIPTEAVWARNGVSRERVTAAGGFCENL